MTSYWPTEDGWPYPDVEGEEADARAEFDDDLFSLRAEQHLLDDLDPLERQVIEGHYGLAGAPALTMKELHVELGLPRTELRHALGSGLAKLRSHLSR